MKFVNYFSNKNFVVLPFVKFVKYLLRINFCRVQFKIGEVGKNIYSNEFFYHKFKILKKLTHFFDILSSEDSSQSAESLVKINGKFVKFVWFQIFLNPRKSLRESFVRFF